MLFFQRQIKFINGVVLGYNMAIIHVDSVEDYEKKIENESKLVIADFWAPWCGPCRVLAPTFEEVSKEYDDVVFVKINVDEAQDIAARFNIMSIPTLLIFDKGEVVDQQRGALSKDQLKDFIDANK